MQQEQLEKLISIYCDGVINRGDGGVIFVRGDSIKYQFSNEFTQKDFATKLQETINDDKENIYVVLEKDSQYHLLAYRKSQIIPPFTDQNAIENKS
jgi:hypothetical protein